MSLAPAPQDHFSSSQNCKSLAPAEDEQYTAYQDDSYEDYGQYGEGQGYQYAETAQQQGVPAEDSEGKEEDDVCIYSF